MFRFIASLFFLITAVSCINLKYDNVYSISSNTPLTSFACSDGANGLITKYGVQTTGALAGKLKQGVYLAGSPNVAGWNSPSCGSCYQAVNPSNGKSFLFVAVDVAHPDVVSGADAFVIASPNGLAAGSFPIAINPQPVNACFN
ncbi:hypothetical protein TWF694_008432 [Orbilia ellipsospora]|uniref:Cerato-platanin n=1 Tax=Orbilia ellipsospora TaxID=2528407 RepID=A0AAV9XGN8_9PEZI